MTTRVAAETVAIPASHLDLLTRPISGETPTGKEQLQGSRLVAPTGPASCRFTEVVEGRLLGLLWPLGPLAVWLLQRQTAADLRRLHLLLRRQHQRTTPGGDGDRAAQWGSCRRSAWG
jgi:hypothetical protein